MLMRPFTEECSVSNLFVLYISLHLLSCGLPFGSSPVLAAEVIHHNGCAQTDNQDDKGFLDVGFHKDNQLKKKRGNPQYEIENASPILGKHLVILFQDFFCFLVKRISLNGYSELTFNSFTIYCCFHFHSNFRILRSFLCCCGYSNRFISVYCRNFQQSCSSLTCR